ncbi:nicotinate-nucleotide adenylyltransferase [Helicobacter mustelae]|uniref:nicotinate (nicotinamide) nucleotide adenylyltransferase n=1 Tax=Helicobacter mustelae TaxID=217 RepID=UPI000E02CC0B|nr:nicotinate (nicotinamide) nucleotide adenylyltransferase [Helicobacter mustelae]STP13087.1 nicotinate-nucleotide adenylyltransferase [Helicobacter mustelae]
MHLVLYGGSFDPPHIAHIEIIKEVSKSIPMDLLVVMVAYHNPLKFPCIFSEKLRLKWMRKICGEWDKVLVSDYEITHKIAYTIQTIEYLEDRYKPSQIDVILGEDNFATLHQWHRVDELKKKVRFIMVRREGFEFPSKVGQEICLKNITVPISSTQIRASKGLERAWIPSLILQEVLENFKEQI